jgi:hypothetical protein
LQRDMIAQRTIHRKFGRRIACDGRQHSLL